jgi:hypothetical protein
MNEPFGLVVPGSNGTAPTFMLGLFPGTEMDATTLSLVRVPLLQGTFKGTP